MIVLVTMVAARRRYTDTATVKPRGRDAAAELALLLRLSDALHNASTLQEVYDAVLLAACFVRVHTDERRMPGLKPGPAE